MGSSSSSASSSSSSSSSNTGSDFYAKWTEEKPCECSKKNYFTTSLTWVEVPMMESVAEKLASTVIWSLLPASPSLFVPYTKSSPTHEAVMARFKCESCGREFHLTYDLVKKGKRNRWGYYGRRQKEKRHSTKRFSFEHLEECYAQMSEYYDLLIFNCGRWAREFDAKVTDDDEAYCIM